MGWGLGGRELLAGLGKPLLHVGKFQSQEGGAGGENEIKAGGYEGLVAAVDFTEAALGTVAVDGVAHGSPGSDHPDARGNNRGLGGTNPPSQEEGPAVGAPTLLTDGPEVVIAAQALPGAQVHFRRP